MEILEKTELEEKLVPYIEKRWLHFLMPFLNRANIFSYLTERKKHVQIVPHQKDMFNAFKYTPFDDVRVCILGMSPYSGLVYGKPKAHGLAFSYKKNNELDFHCPKSLAVIRNEIENDIAKGEMLNFETDLTRWAKQGVFLLNTALTTEVGSADAHIKLWQPFTRHIIQCINDYNAGVIFCLWGAHANEYASLIDEKKHYILSCGHPATELYNEGNGSFYGNKHFSKINEILKENNKEKIEWV